MSQFYGSYAVGSANQETSVAGAEILTTAVTNFDFINVQACHISVNGGSYFYIPANAGYATDMSYFILSSFKIQESGISFTWNAVHR